MAVEPLPPVPDLDALMLRVAAGDREAFATLYDLVAPVVFGMSRRILRDRAMSEEVTQGVMLEVWKTAGRFDPETGSARAYVLTLAHRRTVDRVRSEQASRIRTERAGSREVTVAGDPVSEGVERELDRAAVRTALLDLSELQRQAIEMAYFQGMTQTQVAEALQVPLGTVKTRMRDGMIRLAEMLGPGR
jgi:RNA polymerase sigma-70 factor (ECF subfamily)